MNNAMIDTEFQEIETARGRADAEAVRIDRFLPPSEIDESMKCVDCGGKGWATLADKQLAQTVEEMEQAKEKRICAPCAQKRCITNVEGRVAMVKKAMADGNDIEMIRSAMEGANWFNAIEEMLPE